MHYYMFNVGDYRRDASHLTLLEHGAYRQLLDTYYLSEKPISSNHANVMRTHSARNAEEVLAVENILSEFFVLTENGYVHKCCEKNIAEYRKKSDKAKESAKSRWDRVKGISNDEENANAMRTHSECNANGMLTINHKPLTINHKPITNNKDLKHTIKNICIIENDDGVFHAFEKFWKSYPKKVGKSYSSKIWKRAKLQNKIDQIIEDLTKRHCWKNGCSFTPHPSTYLNQCRWEDEDKSCCDKSELVKETMVEAAKRISEEKTRSQKMLEEFPDET